MSFIDIVFAVLLGFAVYKGLKNGLFVEVASFVALILGIYLAIKFSNLVGAIFTGFVPNWNPKYIEITAFIITFLLVVIGIHLSAKILTKLADFGFLGWINKLAGVVFGLLKTILALSVVLFIFEKSILITCCFLKKHKRIRYFIIQSRIFQKRFILLLKAGMIV